MAKIREETMKDLSESYKEMAATPHKKWYPSISVKNFNLKGKKVGDSVIIKARAKIKRLSLVDDGKETQNVDFDLLAMDIIGGNSKTDSQNKTQKTKLTHWKKGVK